MSIGSFTGILANKLSTSSEPRMRLFGLLDYNMSKNSLVELMLYLLDKYGSIIWYRVFANWM